MNKSQNKQPHSEVVIMDNIEYMSRFPDKFFDLAVADPEYGIDIANRTGSIGQKKGQGKITRYDKKHWDKNVPNEVYFRELERVSKQQIIWGGNYFTSFLPPNKCWIVWDKKQPLGVTFAMAELAYTSLNKSTKIFSCSRALIGNKVANNNALAKKWAKIHPTQKPVPLYKFCFTLAECQPGQRVLDPNLGSQSSRIAAWEMGLDFYGCEIDEQYFNDGCRRFERETQQFSLWLG